ncbi:TetR/AcrR family transcriptional regulator [Pelomonas sp. KK5]|uniref:TetR/AcrR family transcriptional regulator n=1 Tax=Pelomonas sp. KK5 TaxID=1855730 RepID=UPI00097C6BAF|nr:TetR/AcrR family transcriptional regulator [Pelomonas sp. KK5]
MANLVPKVPAEAWLQAARQTLIDEGIDAVKVDRLAKQLGVTRGGFYHHFVDRDELLQRLLRHWQDEVVFVDSGALPGNPAEALEAIDALVEHLMREDGYDPKFDMAVRAWAHASEATAAAVASSDEQRIEALTKIFSALGCRKDEAQVRARVFYFHQIGYYAIGVHESRGLRRQRVPIYIEILCGEQHLAAARAWAAAHQPQVKEKTN